MATEPAILYVHDLARMLGRTEGAIRAAVNRGAQWLPPSFAMGRRLAWRKEDVDKFLATQAKKTAR
jgi:predicted DNA-binding transcriptional regulator AlpA